MRAFKTLGVVAVVAVAAILVYQVLVNNKHLPPSTAQNSPDTTTTPAPAETDLNAAKNGESAEDKSVDLAESPVEALTDSAENSNTQPNPDYSPLAAYEIGNEPLQDEALLELVDRLNNDPVLMAALIEELRAETDPARLKRLVYILGTTANEAVLPAAEELIYSGSESARDTGLDLLSRISSTNPEAMLVASNLLVSENEPDVLIATMNVLAQPGNADSELRKSLVTQITPLSNHESISVRGFTVSTLARLTNDPDVAPVFYNALFDTEPAVRRSGVYAFSSYPYHSPEASQKLLDMVEDDSEHVEVRRGAILALSNNSPDELTKSRIDAAQLTIRRKLREKRLNRN